MAMFDGGRSEYTSGVLDFADLDPDPMAQLAMWLEDAKRANVIEPTAMTLATVDSASRPSARVVLLRGLDAGLQFYSNYHSRKGHDLMENPHACVCFWWGALERQVRVEGVVERLTNDESDRYFDSRPRDSRAASSASPQSQVIDGRDGIEALMQEYLAQETIERPEHWGGYRLKPSYFEFWQGRKARLHDRFAYVPHAGGWTIHRLAP